MRWFTSDTHFGHARIIELCNRPFKDIDEMDWTIVNNWNSVVEPDDEVWHLGDVALGPKDRWADILNSLNGHLKLAIGNHDTIFAGNKQKYREKYAHLYDRFEFTNPCPLIHVGIDIVNLCHFPYSGDSHDEDRYSGHRLLDNGTPLIHGHTHGQETATVSDKGTPQFHVGMDAWGYMPVPEAIIVSWLKSLVPND